MLYNISLLLIYLYTEVGNSQSPTLSFSLTSSLTTNWWKHLMEKRASDCGLFSTVSTHSCACWVRCYHIWSLLSHPLSQSWMEGATLCLDLESWQSWQPSLVRVTWVCLGIFSSFASWFKMFKSLSLRDKYHWRDALFHVKSLHFSQTAYVSLHSSTTL